MTKKPDLLKQACEISSLCDRCGACLTVCPLFGEKDIESSSARGKNNLALGLAQGVVKPTPELLNAVNFCLLCRTCVDNCPTKVQTDEAMIAVRQHLTDEIGGVSFKHKALGKLMKSRPLVKLSAAALGVMRGLGINKLMPAMGMWRKDFSRSQVLRAQKHGFWQGLDFRHLDGDPLIGLQQDSPAINLSFHRHRTSLYRKS